MTQDCLLFGNRDAKVQGQFLCIDVNKLTLGKALSRCHSAEVTNKQLKEKEITQSKAEGSNFNWLKWSIRRGLRQCPAFGKTCFVCDRNHFVKMCTKCIKKVYTVATLLLRSCC